MDVRWLIIPSRSVSIPRRSKILKREDYLDVRKSLNNKYNEESYEYGVENLGRKDIQRYSFKRLAQEYFYLYSTYLCTLCTLKIDSREFY